jgi:hypothetical protein
MADKIEKAKTKNLKNNSVVDYTLKDDKGKAKENIRIVYKSTKENKEEKQTKKTKKQKGRKEEQQRKNTRRRNAQRHLCWRMCLSGP